MKAISYSKFEHLKRSLEELECLLAETCFDSDPELHAKVILKRMELQDHYKRYQNLLRQLERVTKGYEELSMDVKVNVLGKHLKELQKTVKPGCPGYGHLYLGVQLLYST